MEDGFDVIVVGSGPSGAMLALDLARRGARVLVLEKGGGELPTGQIAPMLRARELLFIGGGVSLIRGVRSGGTSTMFFLTAMDPPLDVFSRYGVDLGPEVEELHRELPIAPLAEPLVGPFAARIREGARRHGDRWEKLPKFLFQERCAQGQCPPEARWSARLLLEEAQRLGASVRPGVEVLQVRTEGGRAVGVEIRGQDGATDHVSADAIALAAGGIATPLILRRSGIAQAGEGFFCDPLSMVMGTAADIRGGDELPMAAGFVDREHGYMLADMTLPANFYRLFTAQALRFDRLLAHPHALTLMVKIRDGIGGRIKDDGRPRRRFGAMERDVMAAGVRHARAILEAAGATHIFQTPWTAAHPGGTVRLGSLVDEGLMTGVRGLYVCDASVIPEPWGLPPTLTILALAKYLARRLA